MFQRLVLGDTLATGAALWVGIVQVEPREGLALAAFVRQSASGPVSL